LVWNSGKIEPGRHVFETHWPAVAPKGEKIKASLSYVARAQYLNESIEARNAEVLKEAQRIRKGFVKDDLGARLVNHCVEASC
jgi:hypothetical protein